MILLYAVVKDGDDDAFAGHVLRPSTFHRHVEATTAVLNTGLTRTRKERGAEKRGKKGGRSEGKEDEEGGGGEDEV